jgi:NAD(P)-dependent dehydrogenase (short-subunit alcohol dehydrogenase family)
MKRKLWVVGGTSGIGQNFLDLYGDRFDTAIATGVMGGPDVREPGAMLEWLTDKAPIFTDVVWSVGIQKLGRIGKLDNTACDIMDTNADGFIHTVDALVRAGYGSRLYSEAPLNIVVVVSDAYKVPMRGSIAYCASKAALAMAIRCAAREMAPDWRVNGVSPTVVDDTPITRAIDQEVPGLRGWTPEQASQYELSLIPMGRRVQKYEVSEAIWGVLNGPDMMTGSIIDITGGK